MYFSYTPFRKWQAQAVSPHWRPWVGVHNNDDVHHANAWSLTRIDDPLIPGGQGYVQYQYDSRGNAIDCGAWGSHVIDLADRLRSMTGQGVSATYDYDGHRRRVLISEPGAPRRVQFHNSAGLLLAEIGTNSANTTTELKTYFYQGRNLVAVRKRTLSQDTTHYVHSDHLGSRVARTNTVGYAYERTMYEPYGLKANSAPNGPYGVGLFPDGIGFAGHRVDRVSGLSYMQQRYYDPVAGRFISPDPVPADAGALFNRYAYANNNPVTLVDTDGRAANVALRIIGVPLPNPVSVISGLYADQAAQTNSVKVVFLDPKTGERAGELNANGVFVPNKVEARKHDTDSEDGKHHRGKAKPAKDKRSDADRLGTDEEQPDERT